MKVGTAQVDITPRANVELSGYVARVQPARGVHDHLYARALFLVDQRQRLLWLHADLIGFERAFVCRLKRKLAAQAGLRPREIVVSATHTHSGPATVHLENCGRFDAQYVRWVERQLLRACRLALAEPQPAALVYGEARCDLAVDRRAAATRHTDPRVGILAWQRPGGTFAAVLANYPIHNVALGPANRLVSADMAGRAARQIALSLPGRPVVLLVNGGAGNLNPPAVGNDFTQMAAWGDRLAEAVMGGLASARGGVSACGETGKATPPSLWTRCRTVQLPLRNLSTAEVRAVAERQLTALADRGDFVAQRCREAIERWARRMLRRVRRRDNSAPTVPMEIQAVVLGPAAFVTFGAEVFSLMADELREQTGRRIYVVGYAGGLLGYLAPRYAHQEGGYETDAAFIFYGTLPIGPEAYELARKHAVDLLRSR